jgi:hypothetical protein
MVKKLQVMRNTLVPQQTWLREEMAEYAEGERLGGNE